ncbi:MAG TPA: hypothetical protein DFR83_20585, partial [Deltaproteobacteria bacterium]|nr:hypothetical protein [Deltaproteobacteria bacterium]
MSKRTLLTALGLVSITLGGCVEDTSEKPVEDGIAADAYEGDNEGECTDGADNDRNGLYDCDDPGCASGPDCAATGEGEGEG